jgi:uncharacterized protein (DUF302 family)
MAAACNYGFGANFSIGYQDALARVEQLLAVHGFKIYTRLNLQEIVGDSLRDKMGRYVILGACNPEFAKELFEADPDIGLQIPCNIVIYERRNGQCRIMIKDPARIMDLISSPVAIQAAIRVKEQLEQVIEDLISQCPS